MGVLQGQLLHAQEKIISVKAHGKSIRDALSEIEIKSGYTITYSDNLLNGKKNIAADMQRVTLSEALTQVLAGTGLGFSIDRANIIIYRLAPAKKQGAVIKATGEIHDLDSNEPIPGATVRSGNKGVLSNGDGTFALTPDETTNTLLITSQGYKPKSVEFEGEHLNIFLEKKRDQLNEVVVTALGITKEKKALGHAVQEISGEEATRVKGVEVGTALTGKVAGLVVQNSSEFLEAPTLTLRGVTPLLVIDGVPYGNLTLRDISADDIENISVLKGATAAALYGGRGGNGVIMLTTKKGTKNHGLTVSVNSNTMFNAGFLTLPKVQHSYSAGIGGNFSNTDYVWGAKLDIGTKAMQWNPLTKQMEESELTSRGKDNFKNFLQPSYITNNNISISQTGELGSFRASLTNINTKGQYPNSKANLFNFLVGGDMHLGKKFSLEASMGYNKRYSPQIWGSGYSTQGYIYNILMWTGPEYDLRQYRNYWVTPNVQQNWMYKTWYDNPYLIAYEKLDAIDQNTFNTNFSAKYQLLPGVNIQLRNGVDYTGNTETKRNPPSVNSTSGGWQSNGMYSNNLINSFSINNDVIVTANKRIGGLGIDALAGGTIYYYQTQNTFAATRNGLSIPGFYSLANSVERPDVTATTSKKQVNSLYGQLMLSWKSLVYVDVTGRNDWSSTLPKDTRSYFYPSVGTSFVLSELWHMPAWLDFWKIRGSWALTKNDLSIYATNQTYTNTQGAWGGYTAATYPTNINSSTILPTTSRTWEMGTAAFFLKNRVQLDVTYYNKYNYNQQINAPITPTSGFLTSLINTKETTVRRGVEVTVDATPVKKQKFEWNTSVNLSTSKQYFKALDPVFSADNLWTKVGQRTDAVVTLDWEKDPHGNIIHMANGLPLRSTYASRIGFADPSWIIGFSNRIRYGNFTLSAGIDGRIGGLMYEYMNDKMWDTGSHPDSDNKYRYDETVNKKLTFIGNGVKVVSGDVQFDSYGRITKDTRVFAKNDQVVSYETYARKFKGGNPSGNLNPSFLKLREVSLEYGLPATMTHKLGVTKASVAVTASNALMWREQFRFADPDKGVDNLNSPTNRYIGGNIKVTF